MRTIGKITTGLLLIALGVAVLVLVRSMPDLRRYARIRAM
jgi:hypothetical protein